jgi:hypothetical protein
MFKKLLKLVVALVIAVAGVLAYSKYAPGSRVGIVVSHLQRSVPQLFKSGHVRASDIAELGKDALEQSDRDIDKQHGKAVVYKWRDANGNWTYGNTPPPGVQATAQELDLSKTNRLSQ